MFIDRVSSAPTTATTTLVTATCQTLEVGGIGNIPKSSKYYKASLDSNHDGIACQR